MSLAKIVIYLQKNGKKDDVLTISPDTNSTGYCASFSQPQIGTVSKRYIQNNKLMSYIDMFFLSVVNDECRCDKIQIDCPSFPTVILDPEDVFDYLEAFETQIDGLQDTWATESLLTQ